MPEQSAKKKTTKKAAAKKTAAKKAPAKSKGSESTHHFEAEVQQLLDIVINSLYTDKDIFVRELVSNASDALEKLRLVQLKEKNVHQPELEMEIHINCDEEAGTLIIADRGIGMSKAELTQNLGTIAHSGSKAFLKNLKESQQKDSNLIGQFGVGFYSAFMAAEQVEVRSQSWDSSEKPHSWKSDGLGGYSIEEIESADRGCQIIMQLKEDCKDFAKKDRIKGILDTYSRFVPFPVLLDGERVNTVEAIWLKNKKDLSEEEYSEFYKYSANAWDEPRYRLHFNTDAPISINSLLFVPQKNPEVMGMGQVEPGVALYCQKVLIDNKPEGLLPEWLRFLKGVIDSADLPLNISRESMQDSSLVRKLGEVITKRFLKHLGKEAKDKPEEYLEFYRDFSHFLKEGAATDFANKELIGKLLRFESSMQEEQELTSFQDYLERCTDEQDCIYYQIGPSRKSIEAGPYLEAFKAKGLEVLFLYEAIDEYVLNQFGEFEGKKFVAVDRANLDISDIPQQDQEEALSDEESEKLCQWLQDHLGERVKSISSSKRLIGSPVAAFTPEDAPTVQMRQMMKAMNPEAPDLPVEVNLEINPKHPLIKNLSKASVKNEETAKLVASQLHDNALLSAGLLENADEMLTRMYRVMEEAL